LLRGRSGRDHIIAATVVESIDFLLNGYCCNQIEVNTPSESMLMCTVKQIAASAAAAGVAAAGVAAGVAAASVAAAGVAAAAVAAATAARGVRCQCAHSQLVTQRIFHEGMHVLTNDVAADTCSRHCMPLSRYAHVVYDRVACSSTSTNRAL
jgi:hypothetical protein